MDLSACSITVSVVVAVADDDPTSEADTPPPAINNPAHDERELPPHGVLRPLVVTTRRTTARYPGSCYLCFGNICVGDRIVYVDEGRRSCCMPLFRPLVGG